MGLRESCSSQRSLSPSWAARPSCPVGTCRRGLPGDEDPGAVIRRLGGLLTAPLAPTGPTEIALVISITDGDTIWVDILGEESRVRYIGIDTPEIGFDDRPAEPFAEEATTANAALVEDELVVLETDVSETDDFGRLLRYVWLAPDDDTADSGAGTWRLVNLELVRAGLAEARDYPPDTKYSDAPRRRRVRGPHRRPRHLERRVADPVRSRVELSADDCPQGRRSPSMRACAAQVEASSRPRRRLSSWMISASSCADRRRRAPRVAPGIDGEVTCPSTGQPILVDRR